MRPIRFIHAAGLHLNSPYSGLRDPGASVDERLRAAPFEAFRNLQALCESEAPDFLLVAGGVFDLADRSVHAQLAFRDGLAAITGAGTPVYLAHGKNDPAAAWLPAIDWPDGVHVMGGRPEWWPVIKDDEMIARVQGVSQLSSSLTQTAASDFHEATNAEVFALGLVSEIAVPEQVSSDPFEGLPDLHYWALGSPRDGAPESDQSRRVLATGPVQALSPQQTGPHGCYLVVLPT
ncbi:MAG: hypothetical protein O3C10_10235 [Chloroflexi bacterium]|nr:hypothetical protein [Chloroflexota bacterium]